jgi:hypothetical protein
MAKERRILLNEELQNLYFLTNIGMIKSRKMSWFGASYVHERGDKFI